MITTRRGFWNVWCQKRHRVLWRLIAPLYIWIRIKNVVEASNLVEERVECFTLRRGMPRGSNISVNFAPKPSQTHKPYLISIGISTGHSFQSGKNELKNRLTVITTWIWGRYLHLEEHENAIGVDLRDLWDCSSPRHTGGQSYRKAIEWWAWIGQDLFPLLGRELAWWEVWHVREARLFLGWFELGYVKLKERGCEFCVVMAISIW